MGQDFLDPDFDVWGLVWQQTQPHISLGGLGDSVRWIVDPAHWGNEALVLLALTGLVLARRGKRNSAGAKADVQLPAEGRHLLWGLFARHEQRVNLSGARFDIAWRHIGILGTSGSRKSTLMAWLLERIDKTFACLTGDHSPPLLNLTLFRGGIIWRPRGEVAWYPWGGPLEHAVQRVEHMFPASGGDVGVHRSMFKLAARLAWAETKDDFETTLRKRVTDADPDRADERRRLVRKAAVEIGVSERARTVEQVMALLPVLATGSSGKTMAENWIPRLQELVESLGPSLASAVDGGFDLVEQLAAHRDVMFALNSFADVSNRERFAKIAILEILRASDSVGNLTAAIDEVGLLGAELFAESVRTLRVRRCTGIFASHIAKDFPEVLKGLINVWFLGQVPGSDKATRSWESDTTFGRIPPEHFGEHALKLGDFYLVANGRVQEVTVPVWRTRPAHGWAGNKGTVDSGPDQGAAEPGSLEEWDEAGNTVQGLKQDGVWNDQLEQDEGLFDEAEPVWLRGDGQLLNIYRYVEVKSVQAPGVQAHRLSRYHLQNRGRPMCTYDGDDWLPYALMLALAEGRDLREVRIRMADRTLQGLTCDHLCRELDPSCSIEEERRCQEITHLRWKLRGGNTAIQWARKRRRLQAVS